MVWNALDEAWEEMFDAAKTFAVSGKPLSIPPHYRPENGRDLYDWYIRQKGLYKAGKLSADRVQKLLSIGADLKKPICQQSGMLENDVYYRKNA